MSGENSVAWAALQERAGSRVALLGDQGLPNRKVEAWRYTSLQSLGKTAWMPAFPLERGKAEALLAGLAVPEGVGRIVFGNGHELSAFSSLPSCFMKETPPPADSAPPSVLDGRFSAGLNAALRQEGLHIRVPAGMDAGCLALVSLHDGDGVSIHLRHRIVLEEGASLTLLDVQSGVGAYLANPAFEVVCAQGATLRHVKRQIESREATHICIVYAHIHEKGNYDSFTLNHGGALARHEVVSVLDGPHANTNVNAVQLVDGARLNDLTSVIYHASPECTSRQTVRTVLLDNARGVFQGKILVDKIAQKTDGYQMNQVLLLSEKAQINSKPELEIYADDVRCSHGATVGALDEEQLFYLQSRGIRSAQARAILVQAFLHEAVDLLEDEALKAYLLGSLPHTVAETE